MRGLRRNKRKFWYCLYKDTNKPGSSALAGEAIAGITIVGDSVPEENFFLDENGFETGEIVSRYRPAKSMSAMVSSTSGQVQAEPFGTYEDYDRVIVTAWTDCPIDENTVLFLDKEPEYEEIQNYDFEESKTLFGDDTITPRICIQPVYDYRVTRVSRGVNGARIFVRKAAVT